MSTEEEARQSIRALRDSIHELIRMCSVTGDDDAKVVREKGIPLIPHMMTALGNLGEYDARFSGSSGENWLELLPDFIGSVHVFAAAVGDESVHSVIGRCASLLVECRKLLQGHWNTDLPNSPMMTALLQNIVAPAGEEYKSMNIDAVAARTEKGNEPKGKFVDVTPPPEKLMDEEKIHCQEQSCAALFSSHAAARLHYKKYHPTGILYVSPLKVVDPTTGKKGVVKTRIDKIQCKLCKISLPRAKIKTHFIKVHSLTTARDKKLQLRGWYYPPGPGAKAEPILLKAGEDIPRYCEGEMSEDDEYDEYSEDEKKKSTSEKEGGELDQIGGSKEENDDDEQKEKIDSGDESEMDTCDTPRELDQRSDDKVDESKTEELDHSGAGKVETDDSNDEGDRSVQEEERVESEKVSDRDPSDTTTELDQSGDETIAEEAWGGMSYLTPNVLTFREFLERKCPVNKPPEDDEQDSDWEMGDSEEYTEKRMKLKAERYMDRNSDQRTTHLHQLQGNKEVMECYAQWLGKTSAATSATGETTSTLTKYSGHLFTYADSWLHFETDKDPDFQAQYLFCFGQVELKLISNPLDWVQSDTGKETSGRRKEKLKAHASFRKYIKHCIDRDKNKFGQDLTGMIIRGEMLRDLENLGETIGENKLWGNLQKMAEQNRVEKVAAVETLNPQEVTNIRQSIKTWNESEYRKIRASKAKEIWKKAAMEGVKPREADFVSIGNFILLEVHNLNRDRASAYKFTNGGYASKRPKYVMESTHEEGHEADQFGGWIFNPEPQGWNADGPPQDNPEMPPTGWVITLLGDVPGMKMQEATTVAFTPSVKEWCDKYREVKEVFFKDNPDLNAKEMPFFVNGKGLHLGPLVNKQGSILWYFSEVTGVTRATANTARKLTAGQLLSHPYLSTQEERLQHHAPKVSHRHYDKDLPNLKMNATSWLEKVSGGGQLEAEEIPEAVQAKRRKRDLEDQMASIEAAQRVLAAAAKRSNPVKLRTKQWNLTREERNLIENMLKERMEPEQSFKKISKGSNWKRVVYRLVDSEEAKRMRAVEAAMFHEKFKDFTSWEGTKEENKEADMKIANAILSSLKHQESVQTDKNS